MKKVNGTGGLNCLNPSLHLLKVKGIDWYAVGDCKGRPQGVSWVGFHNSAEVAGLCYTYQDYKPWRFCFKLSGMTYYFRECPLLGMIETGDYLEEWKDLFWRQHD